MIWIFNLYYLIYYEYIISVKRDLLLKKQDGNK